MYKVSSITERDILGTTTRAPKSAIAYKFPTLTAVTTIQDIEIQVGRTGALTPVAILEPVDIGGVVVSRASLHNFQYAQSILGYDERKVVKVGESIVVGRAGDIIPQVLGRVNHDDKLYSTNSENNNDMADNDKSDWISLIAPLKCPACGSAVSFDMIDKANASVNETGSKENEGKVPRCSGPQ